MEPSAAGPVEGIVAGVYSHKIFVFGQGQEWLCALKGGGQSSADQKKLSRKKGARESMGRLVVGDRVMFFPHPDLGLVETRLERQRVLSRAKADKSRFQKEGEGQIVAANVDLVVVAASVADPPFNQGLAERIMAAGLDAGIPALICVTKLDLDKTEEYPRLRNEYRGLGVDVIGVSRSMPESLAPLRAALRDKVAVLVGHSGVGKTSLMNQLTGTTLATGEVGRGGGRHTTTAARLVPLEGGGFLIDSPGVREFGLHGLTPHRLAAGFLGFQPFLGRCGFRDCLHREEPRCGVLLAVEQGRLDIRRYQFYLQLLKEVQSDS
ncbi:MAG: ribosome small subunit-dependent GTPase A [Deltaproteobacteria bacterium]|nr:ribosome small subunit-dependent GTPase A [Deltaproteobacteria bacterium]